MKVLVAIKRVIDPYVKIRVKSDGSGVEQNNVKMAMNPFCEIAVEEAVRLKEASIATEVIVMSAGETVCQEQLRAALALGADRAIHIEAPAQIEPLNVAGIIHAVMKNESPDLVILGKQSIDSDNNQVAQMLAAIANLPQGTFASQIEVTDRQVNVTREVDGGLETVKLNLPAVISTDLRLNEPRYASLPNIMKAKQKPLEVISLETLGVTLSQYHEVLEVMTPAARKGGEKVSSVAELVDKLKNEAKVIS
ncbi:electron transfer flavoprotein subunit beta/FixA family protein [Photobacterium sp. CCB-ST2H9]|uniref:electron transfer flavoprotein subunit beta/FixA family protein n=1 Tax=Photobacterium sp. CCB-ST2H9 TaxID=2912855 RepID=UPI00200571B2|nr:electron transfer flavoprotein subunit beta/FixA family protein [Photobacterium sp. CCB-ST2H9]UTM60138.1 electron transfer flavoprotein subunit beta/FixA family protein [Photobacterium sp. CCB-ST2H9]